MKPVKLDFPMIRQRTGWDCGVATCLMYAAYRGSSDSWRVVTTFLGADQRAPCALLRPLDGVFRSDWRGTLPPDLWAYFAQFWKIPRRIQPGEIGRTLRNRSPVLYLCDDDGHWAWITGIRDSGWRVHCPTLGIYWTRELEGHYWRLVRYERSYVTAYALGTRAMAEVAWAHGAA